MTAIHRVARFLGLIPSRHPAGSLTGWSCQARIRREAFDDFSRTRSAPLGIFPMAAPDYPSYSPKDAA
ncbi:hypothetical protein [Nonomuraea sp. NPDC050643]|uniref:hypothetical protein n=1 Tax=Nonomuraea sp. NPDC050643 TaxID=3155660 RepID=UPI00340C6216